MTVPVRFKLTIPHDAQFVAAVRQVAERVAQCSGFTAADAQTIASRLGEAVEHVLRQSRPSADHEGLDIRFERDPTHLEVWLRYRVGDGDQLASNRAGAAAVPGTDRVETGRDGEISYWRLRCALPHEKVDHQCEMPRDGH